MFDQRNVKLWRVVLPLLTLANVAYLTHNVFGWIFTLAFFLIVPGYLLLKFIIKSNTLGIARIILSIGLSLSLLTISGLLLNCLYFFGIARPLQTINIFIALDIMVLILILTNWSAIINIRPNLLHHLRKEELVFGSLFTLLPMLSIFGAIRLNNGGSNILTMTLMGLIGGLYVTLMVRPNMKRLYPYVILITAISILFCNSLRGWSITGHDIHHEFNVFNAVMNRGYWSPLVDKGDPYNACLSITILPTILAKITDINPIFIYKIVFQIVFATMVPALYLFAKKFVSEKKSLLGVFAFMTFPTFTNDLPFLNRQEIAFGYFILVLLVNFSNVTYRAKSVLTLLLLVSIILSHYSTSYVTISLLLLALLVYKLLSVLAKNTTRLNIPLLSLPIIVMAFLATFIWNAQITASSNNLTGTLSGAVQGMLGKNNDSSAFGKYGLFSTAPIVTPANELAKKAVSAHVAATYVPSYLVPLTGLGKELSKVADVSKFNAQLHGAIALILQLLVVGGTTVLFIRYCKNDIDTKNIYFLSISISCLIALLLFTLLPQLAIGYDVTRLFQQSMMLLWLPVIIALELIFGWLGKLKLIASAALLIFLYFNIAGFIPQLTGGFLPQLSLNNSGVYYDNFYTHKSDFAGSAWLADERITYMNVFLDINSAAPPLKYPVALGLVNGAPQGYYYTDYANSRSGHYRTILNSGFAQYTNSSFTSEKDLIYTNSGTKIYFKWPD